MKDSDAITLKTAKRLRAIRIDRERGEVRPSIDMYERIAKALKTTAADLFPF